jgi:hypothetical protein
MVSSDLPPPKNAAPHQPTCSSYFTTPFAANPVEILDLNPFDSSALRTARASNIVSHCLAFPKTMSSSQDRTTTVPCSNCPHGYSDNMNSLACRPSPACDMGSAESCTRCMLNAQTPQILVDCENCISKQCNKAGNCACVW